MEFTVFCLDADGDEIWLTRFGYRRQAEDLANNLLRAGIDAWVEEY